MKISKEKIGLYLTNLKGKTQKLYTRFQSETGLFKTIFYISVISFVISAFLLFEFWYYRSNMIERVRENSEKETKKTAAKLDTILSNIITIADSVANDLSSGKLKKSLLKNNLTKYLDYRNKIFGIGVAYIPYVNEPSIRYKSPYYVSSPSISQLREKRDLIKVYQAPIYKVDSVTNFRIVTGYVYVDMLESEIKDIMALELNRNAELNANKSSNQQSSYGYLLSDNGTFIAYPISEYNLSEFNRMPKTILEIATEKEDKQLSELGKRTIVDKSSGIMDYYNDLTGQDLWIFHEPVKEINWTLIVSYVKDYIFSPQDKRFLRNLQLIASIFLLIFFFATSSLFVKAYTGNTNKLWIFIVLSSFAFIFEIGFIWHLELTYNKEENANLIKILDRTGLDNFKNSYTRKVKDRCGDPMYIPTGINIQSMQFPTGPEVFFTGYIWQKYTRKVREMLDTSYSPFHKDKIEDIKFVGVFFPEATKTEIMLSYVSVGDTSKGEDYITYGWYFRTTIKKEFNYSKYPLDSKNLSIMISPMNMAKNVVLVPDLDGYKLLNPTSLPGLATDFKVDGWQPNYCNYGYTNVVNKSNYGIYRFDDCKKDSPQFVFDVNFTRHIGAAIITKAIPVGVMMFILFILLTITTQNIEYVTRILGSTSSFFFFIIYAHQSTRTELAVQGMVYFEYFYMMQYVLSLMIFMVSILYYQNWYMKKNNHFFEYKNNLISKLLFWPITFTLFLIITIYWLMVK